MSPTSPITRPAASHATGTPFETVAEEIHRDGPSRAANEGAPPSRLSRLLPSDCHAPGAGARAASRMGPE